MALRQPLPTNNRGHLDVPKVVIERIHEGKHLEKSDRTCAMTGDRNQSNFPAVVHSKAMTTDVIWVRYLPV
jgi:hypothetical protein